jgi:hypothetical protein
MCHHSLRSPSFDAALHGHSHRYFSFADGADFQWTDTIIGSASSEKVATIEAKATNDSGIRTLLATEFENHRRNTRS